MSFTVGQTVVHPHHGAAVINDLENRVFDGREMQYLVLTAPDTDLTLRSAGQHGPALAIVERAFIRLAMLGRR